VFIFIVSRDLRHVLYPAVEPNAYDEGKQFGLR